MIKFKKQVIQCSKDTLPLEDAIPNYFQHARNWADDFYTTIVASRNRYKIAFLSMVALSTVLALGVCSLIPLQHTELVVVHEGEGGYTWLSTTRPHEIMPLNWARTRSEIAHYVVARESYDPLLYAIQTQEVNLLSTSDIQTDYAMAQDSHNIISPIHLFGAKGYRTVTIHNVMMLDDASQNKNRIGRHINLAQVNFVTEDHVSGTEEEHKAPYMALVSWKYTGIPTDPEEKLKNWDGFKITKYEVEPVNTH